MFSGISIYDQLFIKSKTGFIEIEKQIPIMYEADGLSGESVALVDDAK